MAYSQQTTIRVRPRWAVGWMLCVLWASAGCAGRKQEPLSLNEAIESGWPAARELDQYVLADAAARTIPGLSVAVVRYDRVVYARGYGVMDRATREPVTPTTQFAIASLTKTFTAALLLNLRDESRLSLSDVLWRRLPQSVSGERSARHRPTPPIQLSDILSHAAGFPRQPPNLPKGGGAHYDNYTCAQLRDALATTTFDTSRGRVYEYSNFGYSTLGLVIQGAIGFEFDRALSERILEPLGLTHTYIAAGKARDPRRASGYAAEDGFQPVALWRHGCLAPQGALVSTSLDLGRWLAFWLDGAGGSVLRSTTLSAAITPKLSTASGPEPSGIEVDGVVDVAVGADAHPLGRRAASSSHVGYAWHIRVLEDGRRIVEHAGLTGGFGSYMGFCPETGDGAVLLANRQVSMGARGARVMDWLVRRSDSGTPVALAALAEHEGADDAEGEQGESGRTGFGTPF